MSPSNDKQIIKLFSERHNNSMPYLDFITNCKGPETTKVGTKVVKSKYKFVNFLRKLFNCEKTRDTYTFKWNYVGKTDSE